MSVLHLKIKSPTEIRRISIPKTANLATLRESINQLFQVKDAGLPNNFSIKYEDEDNDKISVVTNSDWEEAINFSVPRNGNLVLILGEPIEEVHAVVDDDEISKLEKEFIFLSAVDLPHAKEVLDQAIIGAKDMLDSAKEKIQIIIEDTIPRAGSELQNFFAKQGQNAEEVVQNIHDFVKNAVEDIPLRLESYQEKKPVTVFAQLENDVTIPDGTVVQPDTPFQKTWRLKNTGDVAWPNGTELRPTNQLVHKLDCRVISPLPFYLPSVAPGESITLTVELIAPTVPGEYQSFFRLFHPQFDYFGDIFWVSVVVPNPYKFQAQLRDLLEMGFEESVCIFLLNENNGNIEDCMAELTTA